jgi:HrpA-like RNA helicase
MSSSFNPFTSKPYSARCQALRKTAERLPVTTALPRLIETIMDNQVTIVEAETGSGKTVCKCCIH